jgi:c-di-GMP-binding flagellar brake protein YcgR
MGGEDKRKFPRLNLDVEVNYSLLQQEEGELFTTASKNISYGGICFIAFEKPKIDSLLELRFSFPTTGFKKFIIAKGKVSWVKELDFSGLRERRIYEVGVEFIEMNGPDREKIKEYINKKL